LSGAYACRTLADWEPERWGEDDRLVAVLGERGAAGFRALFDEYPEAVGVLWAIRDESGSIADFAFGYGNPTMMRRTRIPASTPERYTLLKALPRMRGSRAFDAYARVCDTGEPWVEEITYDTPFGDGHMLGTYVLRVSRMGDGLVVFLTDVTEERRMEADLRSYADVVAHDLSEPVASIELLAGLLERRGEEPAPADVVRQLRESARHARELIDGVLSYARAGELHMQPVSLDRLLAEVADEMRPQLEQAAAGLRVEGPLPEVEGDATQLRRVLQNLLANAVKFRGEDPPRVDVSAVPDGKEWVITVRDNGVGVEADRATRIFGMFARGNAGASGTGIGLAVCRRVLEAHGGRIWVEPAEGGGSAFRFTLPRGRHTAGVATPKEER
jgi:signal transduction histidine kinase